MKVTLPIKFSLVSLVITLVSLSFVTWFTFKASEQLLNDQATRKIDESVHLSTRLFDFQINQITKDIHFLLHSIEMNTYIHGSDVTKNRDLSRLFETILNQREMYFQIRVIGVADEGKELIRIYRQGERIKAIGEHELTSKKKRSYFQKGILLPPETMSFAPITLNKEHGIPTFPNISTLRGIAPIYNEEKQLYGLLIINVDLKKLTDSVFEQHENTSYFITNSQGDYLIHPDPSKAMAFDLGRRGNVLDDYPHLEHVFHDFMPNMTRKKEVVTFIDDQRSELLALDHLHLSLAGEKHSFLTLGAVSSTVVARQASISLRNDMLGILMIVTFILTLVTFVFARKLTKPIGELTEKALLFSKGEHNIDFASQGSDEVAQLSQAMKTMLAHLAASRGELAELNISLENQIKVRTSELEYALDQAEEAMQTKGRFLAMMSHEIRTPLNGVLGLTELVLDSDLSTEQRDNLETIHSSGETLLTILNDVLDYSKMEAGQFELSYIPFDINVLMEHVTKLYAKTAQQNHVELICQVLPHNHHLLIGDPDRLRQIMMNLLGNAMKFTHEGEILCAIELLEDEQGQVKIRFEVKDTGIGMSEEVQARLFADFVQADSSTTRKYGGTGLGLSIAQNLAELMHGHIQVESEEDLGSRFTLVLNFEKGERIQQLNHEALHEIPLLIVDDNDTSRSVMQQMLGAWGMHVEATGSAKQGLLMLAQQAEANHPYQLVLLDDAMPEMDGYQFVQQLHASGLHESLKIIMLSAGDKHMAAEERQALGIDAFLRKPAYQTLMLDTIRYVLDESAPVVVSSPVLPASVTFKAARLLLVEDVDVNQQIALAMLKKLGLGQVDVANDGLQALQAFKEQAYDVVLMDIQMPNMDGHTASLAMRAWEKEQGDGHTTIIALTAHAFAEDVAKSKAAGMDDHLTKPLTGKKLLEVMAKWLPVQYKKEEPEALVESTPAEIEPVASVKTDPVEPSVDKHILQRLQQDMGGNIGMILDAFLAALPAQLTALEQGLQDENADALRRDAHRLKGSARNLGAIALGNACAILEAAMQQGEVVAGTAEQVSILVAEVERVRLTLAESWVKELR